MKEETKEEIIKISKQFAGAFEWPIAESGWLIVDPLSGYLNSIGYENKLTELPATSNRNQTLIINFQDGSQLIPGGSNLKSVHKDAKDWMWL